MTRQGRAVLGGVLGSTAAGAWVMAWRLADAAPLSGDMVASGIGIGFAVGWAIFEWPSLKAAVAEARFTRAGDLLAPVEADAPGLPRFATSTIRGRFAVLVLATVLMLSAAMVGLRVGSVLLVLAGVTIAALTGWFAAGDFVTLRRRYREAERLRRIGKR